jgi:multicomponent Na+:H+ antiporter subunit B
MLGFLVVVAIAIALLDRLVAAVILAAIYSLLCASVFVAMDAVDVAFTEAAVGAGVSTVLMLGALALTRSDARSSAPRPGFALAVVTITGAILIYGTLDMPHYGDPTAPAHQHVAPHYLLDSTEEIGLPNVVTSVLASYRGYDTLGEVVVIFTAGMGVVALLGRSRRRDRERRK